MALGKILIILITVHLFLYMAGGQMFEVDIFDRFAGVTDSGDQVVSYGTFGDSVPGDASSSVGSFSSDSTGFSFFDALGLAMDTIIFLFNVMLAPIAIFTSTGMPVMLQLLIGIPMGILYLFLLTVLIRGGGAS